MTVLTTSSPKIDKGIKYGYRTAILYMIPADLHGFDKGGNVAAETGSSVFSLCPFASEACKASCLVTAGHGSIPKNGYYPNGLPNNSVINARLARTKAFLQDREGFVGAMYEELVRLMKSAEKSGHQVAFRPNGTSDVAWWRNKAFVRLIYPLVERGEIIVYDYTKAPSYLHQAPGIHHLTLSRSETNAPAVRKALQDGFNVAAVFDHRDNLPGTFLGHKVEDGDKHDLTFLWPKGRVLGLKAKGRAKNDKSGFVIRRAGAA